MAYEGVFDPPSTGMTMMPIPLAGNGTVDVTADALVVAATRKHHSPGAIVLGFLSVLVIPFAAGVFAADNIAHAGAKGAAIVVVGFGGLVAAILMGRAKTVPWQIRVPWPHVRKVEVFNKELVVTVKGMSPKGTLHFRSPELEAAVVAIRQAAPPAAWAPKR